MRVATLTKDMLFMTLASKEKSKTFYKGFNKHCHFREGKTNNLLQLNAAALQDDKLLLYVHKICNGQHPLPES